MIKILLLIIALLCIEINAKEIQDTILLDRYSSIYQNSHDIIVVNKPKKNECHFKISSYNYRTGKRNFVKNRPFLMDIPTCCIEHIDISENSSMIISMCDTIGGEGAYFSQFIDTNGKSGWAFRYGTPSYEEHRAMLLSPNGKYAVMSYNDSCILYSGDSGTEIQSVLKTEVKGKYIAFFNENSQIIIFNENWEILKYDPVSNLIVNRVVIPDSIKTIYSLDLNRYNINQLENIEKSLFVMYVKTIRTDTIISKSQLNKLPIEDRIKLREQSWKSFEKQRVGILVFNDSLNLIKVYQAKSNLHTIISKDNIFMTAFYSINDSLVNYETRIYTPAKSDAFERINQKGSVFNESAFLRIGNEIIYPHHTKHGAEKSVLKYNFKTKHLDLNQIKNSDSLHEFIPFYINYSN